MLQASEHVYSNDTQHDPALLADSYAAPASGLVEDFQLAMEDAKRAIAEDPLLKRPAIVGVPDDDFSSRLNFRSENWDELDSESLARELMSKTTATVLDIDDYRS